LAFALRQTATTEAVREASTLTQLVLTLPFGPAAAPPTDAQELVQSPEQKQKRNQKQKQKPDTAGALR